MKQVTLHIPNNKYPQFIEFAKTINYIKFVQEDEPYKPYTKKEVLDGIETAVRELNLVKKGKLKTRNAMDLYNEL